MPSPKKLELTALFGLVLQGAFLLTCLVLGARSGSRAVNAEFWYVLPGLLVWFLVLFHGRQRRLAREEREERERLKDTRLSEEIFEETELDTMRASSGLLIFERYVVPFSSVLLSAMLLFFAYRMTFGAEAVPDVKVREPAAVAVGMVFVAFVGFLIGKYAAGTAQSREFRLLRAAGGYVLGNVIAAVLIAVAMAMYYFGVKWGEAAVTYAIPVIMALVGVEILLNLMLDIYRPRVVGLESRPPYDSRLLGLFAEPEGVLRTVAATLDYQFGFKVSETWFYRFMARAILPLLLIQLLSLWLLTTMVVVEKDEVAFVENFGRPYVRQQDAARGLHATVLKPGFYLKAPWPFAVTRHVPAYRTHSVELGKVYEKRRNPGFLPIAKDPDVILWDQVHIDPDEGYEVDFLVPSVSAVHGKVAGQPEAQPAEQAAGDEKGSDAAAGQGPAVNLARVLTHIHYRVKRKPNGDVDENSAFTYYYRQSDIQEHVQELGYRAICRVAASQDFLKWVAEDRRKAVDRLKQILDEAVERENLGLEIVFVGTPVVHPPAQTAAAYSDVVVALENKESLRQEGELEAVQMVEDAKASQAKKINEAKGYAVQQTENARAGAQEFLTRLTAYQTAPLVYMYRNYFEAIEKALPGQFLYLVPIAPSEVQIIDLQEKLRPQLLEFQD